MHQEHGGGIGGGFHPPEVRREVRPVIIERPMVREHVGPVFIHEPVVVREPEVIEAAPVVIQPLVFADIKREELGRMLEKLHGEGYKVHPVSESSGSFEHGGFFGHFTATYAWGETGLQVTVTSHEDKIREDIAKALLFARG